MIHPPDQECSSTSRAYSQLRAPGESPQITFVRSFCSRQQSPLSFCSVRGRGCGRFCTVRAIKARDSNPLSLYRCPITVQEKDDFPDGNYELVLGAQAFVLKKGRVITYPLSTRPRQKRERLPDGWARRAFSIVTSRVPSQPSKQRSSSNRPFAMRTRKALSLGNNSELLLANPSLRSRLVIKSNPALRSTASCSHN